MAAKLKQMTKRMGHTSVVRESVKNVWTVEKRNKILFLYIDNGGALFLTIQ